MESAVDEIAKVAENLPQDSEVKELFYPLMCFFQNPQPTADEKSTIAAKAVNADFDMAVFSILESF
jgi:hypothetical protein